jgi:CDP-diacylglycerol--glycerol-3-phosphate 3-phosphatidyltransferase
MTTSTPSPSPGPEPPRASTFGPTALLTPANGITLARLAATPVIIAMVAVGGPSWWAFAVAFAIGATDGVDGWLARKQGTTRSGAFLDPLADKVAVVGVLVALAARGAVSWVAVVLIAAREVSMQVYRVVMGRRGVSIPARQSAKVKTLVQGIVILLCLAPPAARHGTLVSVVLWLAVALTLLTGVQYVVDGRRATRTGAPPTQLGPGAGGQAPGMGLGAVGEATG